MINKRVDVLKLAKTNPKIKEYILSLATDRQKDILFQVKSGALMHGQNSENIEHYIQCLCTRIISPFFSNPYGREEFIKKIEELQNDQENKERMEKVME